MDKFLVSSKANAKTTSNYLFTFKLLITWSSAKAKPYWSVSNN